MKKNDMRPQLLNPLFASVGTLEGIGQKTLVRVESLVSPSHRRNARVSDLLFHLPASVVDRQNSPSVKFVESGSIATLEVRISSHLPPKSNKAPYKVIASDDTGEITLVFFQSKGDWLKKKLPEGELRYVSGKIEIYNGEPQIVHPDFILTAEEFLERPLIEPVYPLTAGVTPGLIQKSIKSALNKLPDIPEWLDPNLCKRESFPKFTESLRLIHLPTNLADIEPEHPPRRRLAYDEYLAGQLALAFVRQRIRRESGVPRKGTGKLREKIVAELRFELTKCQQEAIREISADLESKLNMHRLLQGDVGSGKTIVALLAMIQVVETGAQAAFMVPTELLARQHFQTVSSLCEKANVRVEIITGRDSVKHRKSAETALANGEIDIIIGTHALFQSGIEFRDLGLAVIDEQHRFGVHQRLALSKKGISTDMLVMTATPIPRSLVLTYYGDMDVTKLLEKPSGRPPVKTTTVPINRLEEVISRVRKIVGEGKKVYWICPLVQESLDLNVTSAEVRHALLKEAIGDQVGLVHGQMSSVEKDLAMDSFKSGKTSVLVATTVIEVGIDIPEASIIVIENAERFGLSQLHQLRGRVGRGDEESHCLLLFMSPLSESAKSRLKILRESHDGFEIAEEDLKLRGEGEILGTRQSGASSFQAADIAKHRDLLEIAHDDAQLILKKDPNLESERGEALKLLLYLFDKEDVISLLQSG